MAKITINKAHFEHNLKLLAQKAGGLHKIMAVLKDNAYGHGLELMANLSKELGIQKVVVKNYEEALRVSSLFDEILVLVDHPPKKLHEQHIALAINSINALQAMPKGSAIHLNIDTGMHRNGLSESEYEEALKIVKENNLLLKGIFTHFRSSDELNSEYFWQESNYKKSKKILQTLLEKNNFSNVAFHSCNSAALLRQKDILEDDYARCGIAMYGYSGLSEVYEKFDLKPVMSLWAKRLSTRVLKKGQKIGYGGRYEAFRDEEISTYDVGYGDGFFRFDTQTEVNLTPKAKIVGKVSMDSLFLKGSEEEVALFHDVSFLATYFNTISYDVLVKLSSHIKREVV